MGNPNFVINPTRLIVRNIPVTVHVNELRQKCLDILVNDKEFINKVVKREKVLKASKNGDGDDGMAAGTIPEPSERDKLAAAISELSHCKIMKDKERTVAETGSKRSLGFAFVETKGHVASLTLLR